MKILLSLLFAGMMLQAGAQIRKVPAEVTDAFKAKYNSASKVSWKDKITFFQAAFQLNSDKVKANYTSKGEWLMTEKNYNYERLPAAVKEGFTKSKYAAYKVLDVTETDDKDKGLQYRVVVKKGDITKRNLYFSASGQLVSDNVNI